MRGGRSEPRVVDLSDTDIDWNASLVELGGGTFCHLLEWRNVLADTLGHESWQWVARSEDGTVEGLLPLARVRSRLFGDYLLSMPFLSYGGPVGTSSGRQALARAAVDHARELGVGLLELRSRTPVPGDLQVSDRKITVLKRLADTAEEEFQSGIKAKLRSQVRRPMKEGMTASFGSHLVDPFYEVFSTTMRDLGTPVLPKRFFAALAQHFPEQVIFAVVEHEGRPAAAGCGFEWGGEVEITWAGADRELSRKAPNMLLYWSFMEESIRRGALTFNFGRCTPGSGTHRFKLQWGAEDHPLPWAQWSPSGVVSTPSPTSAKFRLATSVWSRLPVGVTRAIGPYLARSLP